MCSLVCVHYNRYMSTGMSEKMFGTCARCLSCSLLCLFEGVRRWPATQTLIPLSVGSAVASRDPNVSVLLLHTSGCSYCCSLHPARYREYTQLYTVITLEIMKTFELPKWDSSKVHSHPLKWNIRINMTPHQNEKMTFLKDADSGNTYWFHFFLTGMDSGVAPPQMEVSK